VILNFFAFNEHGENRPVGSKSEGKPETIFYCKLVRFKRSKQKPYIYFSLSKETPPTSHKRGGGGSRGVPIDSPLLVYNLRSVLGTLKGLLSCFKYQKNVYSV
jgi:hypothetical protein